MVTMLQGFATTRKELHRFAVGGSFGLITFDKIVLHFMLTFEQRRDT